jgi:hypothetical protein
MVFVLVTLIFNFVRTLVLISIGIVAAIGWLLLLLVWDVLIMPFWLLTGWDQVAHIMWIEKRGSHYERSRSW